MNYEKMSRDMGCHYLSSHWLGIHFLASHWLRVPPPCFPLAESTPSLLPIGWEYPLLASYWRLIPTVLCQIWGDELREDVPGHALPLPFFPLARSTFPYFPLAESTLSLFPIGWEYRLVASYWRLIPTVLCQIWGDELREDVPGHALPLPFFPLARSTFPYFPLAESTLSLFPIGWEYPLLASYWRLIPTVLCQIWGDELREDVPGHALPLRVWAARAEGSSRYGQGETTLLQVSSGNLSLVKNFCGKKL